jgi:hypothetical protein
VLRWSDGHNQILLDLTSIACDSAGPWLDSVATHAVFDVLLRTSVRSIVDSGLVPGPLPGTVVLVTATLPTHVQRTGLGSSTAFAPSCGIELQAAYEVTWSSPTETVSVELLSTTGVCTGDCPEPGSEATLPIGTCSGGSIQ